MTDLLKIYRVAAYHSLVCLSKDGVEWFFDVGTGGVDKHKRTCHVLHLLNRVLGLNYLVGVYRHKTIRISNGINKTFPVEYLHRQRHVHYGLSPHQI